MNGIQPSLYGEMFPTRVRLSGMAIGTQIGFAIAVATARETFKLPLRTIDGRAERFVQRPAAAREPTGAGVP
jgi:hypothetical protein